MSSCKAKIRLEDGLKILALLDIGVEINILRKEVMKSAGLAMRQSLCLELIFHISHGQSFLGLCKDVEMRVGSLKTKHPIFVVKHRDHNLVLRQLLLNTVKFS